MSEEIIRIGNCSGYYGDKLSAAKDMVEGGPLDVLTGDYLAELTMTILFNQKMQRGEDKGYVGTFLKQVKAVAETCKEKNIKIVTNAGGLNPSSMANEIEKILEELGISLKVAYITGDDLMPRMDALIKEGEPFSNIDKQIPIEDSGCQTLTANAYLGAWGIKEALDAGADIVVCPRVTDAAVVIGPAAWKFNWNRMIMMRWLELLLQDILLNVDARQPEETTLFLKKYPVLIMWVIPLLKLKQTEVFI